MAFTKKPDKKKPPRAKGEGSIFQRADGMWVGSIEAPPGENGKRRQKRVYAKTKLSLVAKLEELKSEAADGLHLDRTTTVEKWLNYWLHHVHRSRIRPGTYRDYGHTVDNIIATIGHKKLIELESADVRRMHTSLGIGRRRAAKAHIVLSKALTDAMAEGLIKRNVAAVVDQPDVAAGEREAIPITEVQKLLAYAAENRNIMESTRWLVAFLTGTRQGETLGLTWDRVDLKNGAIDITWQLQQLKREHGCGERNADNTFPCGKGNVGYCTSPKWNLPVKFEYKPLHAGLALTRPKSDAGNRWVPVIEPLRLRLAELKEADCGPNPHSLVFHRADGRPVAPSDDHAAWISLLREAGVLGDKETLTMHAARHTAATVLRGGGADEQTRMEILGHNSPEVTRIYAHADQAKNSAMMEALGVLVPKELTPGEG